MSNDRHSDCLGVLIDLICYEIDGQRLSFEMEELLGDHLRSCATCRARFAEFRQAVAAREPVYLN